MFFWFYEISVKIELNIVCHTICKIAFVSVCVYIYRNYNQVLQEFILL